MVENKVNSKLYRNDLVFHLDTPRNEAGKEVIGIFLVDF